jgi:hypothetical protein
VTLIVGVMFVFTIFKASPPLFAWYGPIGPGDTEFDGPT